MGRAEGGMWREKALGKLRKSGYKLTPQRIKLVEVLERLGSSHPNLRKIHEEVRKEFPMISFSTLYSNVLILRDLNILDLFYVEGNTHVELNTKPHLNLIEKEMIYDVEDDALIREIEKRTGKKIRLVNIIAR